MQIQPNKIVPSVPCGFENLRLRVAEGLLVNQQTSLRGSLAGCLASATQATFLPWRGRGRGKISQQGVSKMLVNI